MWNFTEEKVTFCKNSSKKQEPLKNEFLEPIVEPKQKINNFFFSKKEIECYYCEGNEIKCFLSSKFSSLPSLKENFIKKANQNITLIWTKHFYEKSYNLLGKNCKKKTNKK